MAKASDTTEKTHQPTVLRLAEARKNGHVAKSSDVTSAAVLLVGILALGWCGEKLLRALQAMMSNMLSWESSKLLAATETPSMVTGGIGDVLVILLPVVAVMMLAAMVACVMQVGMLASGQVIKMRSDRLSPGAGLGRIWSGRSMFRALMAVAKISAVALVAILVARAKLPEMQAATSEGTFEMALAVGRMAGDVGLAVAMTLLALAVFDWLYQRWQYHRDLMMTRTEWLEDLRKMDGDPLARMRRKKKQQK